MLTDMKKSEASCKAISEVIDLSRLDTLWREQYEHYSDLLSSQEQQLQKLQQTGDQNASELLLIRAEQTRMRYSEEESRCLQAFRTSTYEDYKARIPDRVPGNLPMVPEE